MTNPVSIAAEDGHPLDITIYNNIRLDVLNLSPDWMAHRRAARWHYSTPYSTVVNVTPDVNSLVAVPFLVGPAVTATGLGLECSTAAGGGLARVGLYESDNTPYPTTLVQSSAEFDMSTTGAKTSTGLSFALSAGTLYWLVYFGNNAALQVKGSSSSWGLLGCANFADYVAASTIPASLYQVLAYAALPSTYPAGALLTKNIAPLIGVLFP